VAKKHVFFLKMKKTVFFCFFCFFCLKRFFQGTEIFDNKNEKQSIFISEIRRQSCLLPRAEVAVQQLKPESSRMQKLTNELRYYYKITNLVTLFL